MISDTRYIYPEKISASGGAVQNSEALTKRRALQIGLSEPDLAELNGKAFLILDFGKELSGGVRILTHTAEGGRIRLRFGESLSECCSELNENNSTNDHSLRDFSTQLPCWSDLTFGNTGFRFLRIDTEEGSCFRFKNIVAACDADTRVATGTFESDDPLVNDIWNTAAYTLRLCIKNGCLWDGIKRDRLVWVGDLYPEIRSVYSLYGDLPEIRNSLDFSEREGVPPDWINGIPMYSLWWLIELAEDCAHTGDKEYARSKLSYIRSLLEQIDRHVGKNGETTFPYNFIDWAMHYEEGDDPVKKQDELLGVNYLTRFAMQKTGYLLRELGESDALCNLILRRLERNTSSVKRYKQAAALAVLAGRQTETERSVIKADGAQNLSTFMAYPILTALARYNDYDFAMRVLKEYYGGMLALGATTFFEDFDVTAAKNAARIDEFPKEGQTDFHRTFGSFCYKGYRHSLCHGWSSGVVAYLSENVLGIWQEGANRFIVEPHLSGLKHVKGTCPTKYGAITVEHTLMSNGSVKTTADAPEGVTLVKRGAEVLS